MAGERKHIGSGAPLYNTCTAIPLPKSYTTVGVYLTGVRLTSVHLMGVYLMGVHLLGVHVLGVYLIGLHLTGAPCVCLIGVYLMGVHLMRMSHKRVLPHGRASHACVS